MKQFATILFLTVALFNTGGYRLLTGYLQSSANSELEARLDKQGYDEADLVTIKTPLNLPYYSSSPAFERVSGELNVKGVVYKYVKRRVYNDTLEVLCIRDTKRTSIQQAKDEFFKQSNGLTTQTKKPVSSPVKPVFFDYCSQENTFSFKAYAIRLKHSSHYIPLSGIRTGRLVEQPPEV